MRTVVILMLVMLTVAPVMAVDGVALKPGDTIQTVLEWQKGKRITVRLQGGEELTGKVVFVSKELVKLEELTRREFYDAVVEVSKVEAVILRARDK